jgi:hypothetical protein
MVKVEKREAQEVLVVPVSIYRITFTFIKSNILLLSLSLLSLGVQGFPGARGKAQTL